MPKLRHAFATTALIFFAIPYALADVQPQPAAKPAATAPAPQSGSPAPAAVAPAVAPAQAAPPAQPAPPPAPVLPPEVNSTINKMVGVMEGAEKSLTAITNVDTDLGRLRDEIDSVISKTTQTADGLRPRLADVQGQIDRLGAPPESGAPPEAPSIAADRARLDSRSLRDFGRHQDAGSHVVAGAPSHRQDHGSPAAALCPQLDGADFEPPLSRVVDRSRARRAERQMAAAI